MCSVSKHAVQKATVSFKFKTLQLTFSKPSFKKKCHREVSHAVSKAKVQSRQNTFHTKSKPCHLSSSKGRHAFKERVCQYKMPGHCKTLSKRMVRMVQEEWNCLQASQEARQRASQVYPLHSLSNCTNEVRRKVKVGETKSMVLSLTQVPQSLSPAQASQPVLNNVWPAVSID